LHLIVAAGVCLAVLVLFAPTFSFPFLNWDDQEVFVRNAALHAPGFLHWAFTTTYIEHYQPLAWLTWGAVDRLWILTPAVAHPLNVALHAACAVLVFALARRLCGGLGVPAAAALLFALHPLRVEVVAWSSAMPYTLALLFALLATLAFLEARDRRPMFALSVTLYAMSLLARPIAIGLPVVLFTLDWYAAGTRVGRYGRIRRTLPFVVLAAAAAYVESTARLRAAISDVGVGARLTLALTAPLRYLWKTVAPFDLTPLDSLALAPRADITLIVFAAAVLITISWTAWRWRPDERSENVFALAPGPHPRRELTQMSRGRPLGMAAGAWFSYLALLVPVAGLLPSGLQATADRYTYLPSVPLSIWIAAAAAAVLARSPRSIVQPLSAVAAAAVIAALAWITHQQMRDWHDSVALWTRAVAIDPKSDIGLYNLASALAEAGRRAEALARYDEVLRIVPDQGDARRNRNVLLAATAEDDANRLAASGNLEAAIDAYRRAIALDPARTHAQASLGMALVEIGRTADAVPPLREAIRRGAPESAVPNALAFALVKAGRIREACDVLESARARFPGDANVARNLTQLSDECGKR